MYQRCRHILNIPMFFLFCFAGPIGHPSVSVLPEQMSSQHFASWTSFRHFLCFLDCMFSQLKQAVKSICSAHQWTTLMQCGTRPRTKFRTPLESLHVSRVIRRRRCAVKPNATCNCLRRWLYCKLIGADWNSFTTETPSSLSLIEFLWQQCYIFHTYSPAVFSGYSDIISGHVPPCFATDLSEFVWSCLDWLEIPIDLKFRDPCCTHCQILDMLEYW